MRTLWLLLLAATLPLAGVYRVDDATSSVRFRIAHKFHPVEARSSEIEGKAVVKEDGSILATVEVPVASFTSGDPSRDETMVEAVEGGKFPLVVFKGVAKLGPDRALPATPLFMDGEVEFHGVTRPVRVTLSLSAQPDGTIRARGRFGVSLHAHDVKPPSVLFVEVDDICHVDFNLELKAIR